MVLSKEFEFFLLMCKLRSKCYFLYRLLVVLKRFLQHQVTVAHINATAKNAADDKLRQSLRRFAETHTAPATVVLVSCEFLSFLSAFL